jgi:carbonic anhydrase
MWRAPTAPPANGEKNIEKGNAEYAAAFTQGHLALPPSQKYAVCM